MNGFRRRLFLAGQAVQENLEKTLSNYLIMTLKFKSFLRAIRFWDYYLCLLRYFGGTKFFIYCHSAPFGVDLISTPNRKKSVQLCHVNLLKPYFSRDHAESKITAV